MKIKILNTFRNKIACPNYQVPNVNKCRVMTFFVYFNNKGTRMWKKVKVSFSLWSIWIGRFISWQVEFEWSPNEGKFWVGWKSQNVYTLNVVDYVVVLNECVSNYFLNINI